MKQYKGYEYRYVISVFSYGEMSGDIQGENYDNLEEALDNLDRVYDEQFEQLSDYAKIRVRLQYKEIK